MLNLKRIEEGFILDKDKKITEDLYSMNVTDYEDLLVIIESEIDSLVDMPHNNSFLQEELTMLAQDYLYTRVENLANEFTDILDHNKEAQKR